MEIDQSMGEAIVFIKPGEDGDVFESTSLSNSPLHLLLQPPKRWTSDHLQALNLKIKIVTEAELVGNKDLLSHNGDSSPFFPRH
jgi:hypothetical protein